MLKLNRSDVSRFSGRLSLAVLVLMPLVCTACAGIPLGQTAVQPAPPEPADFIINSVLFFLTIFFVFWALVVRPRQVERHERDNFIEKLKPSSEVITTGGIIGKVVKIKPDFISLEIAPNIKIKVLPEHVRPLQKKQESDSEKSKK